jgi:rubrerythrin
MFDSVLGFGELAERMIGAVYRQLAGTFGEDTAQHIQLLALAAEEDKHATMMASLREQVAEAPVKYNYRRIFEGQAEFMGVCLELLDARPRAPEEVTAAIERLASLEDRLAENLFLHLKLLVKSDLRESIEQLANESAGHGERLRGLLSLGG